jgi:dipeptidyl aminopeptidase/acylaminoacyl peptidase
VPALDESIVLRQRLVGACDLAADGSLVAYTLRSVRRGRAVTDLFAVPYRGGRPRRLTGGAGNDTTPRLSADGRLLAFLSDRDEGLAQPYVLDLARRGPPRRLARFRRGAEDLALAPDGRAACVLAADATSPGEVEAATGAGESPVARVVSRLDWRLDGHGLRLHPRHLWLVPRRGRPRRLTAGPWSAAEPVFAPDGESVVFRADPDPRGDVDPRPRLFRVACAGGAPVELPGPQGAVLRHACEPDGGILCLALDRHPALAPDPPRLFRIDPSGTVRPLSDALDDVLGDGSYSDLHDWSVTGGFGGSVATVARRGLAIPFRFAAAGPQPLAGEGRRPVAHDVAATGEAAVAVLSLDGAPPELHALDGGAPRRLTRHGGWLPAAARLPVAELDLPGPAGPIQAFVVSPPGGEDEPRATILDVHGGPTAQWNPLPPLEALVLAHAGYRVVLPNIRGSIGHGRAWVAALQGDWGGADAADCHAVLDALVARGLADPARLGALGLSYGGFMVNWLVATSDRFAAAVAENGVVNQVSAWANCDVGPAYGDALAIGAPTSPEGVELLWRQSPLRHVADVRTPLMLLQGEADLRCPAADAEQLFVALRRLGREVSYVLYPEESHELQAIGRPDRRVDRLRRVLGWFARHLPA